MSTDRIKLSGNISADRHKRRYGSDAGSDGHGYETCGNEQACIKEVARQQLQCQIHSGIDCAYLLCCGRKCSSKDEYPYHQQDIGVGRAMREDRHPFLEGLAASNDDRIYGCNDERRRHRHCIEILGDDGRDKVHSKEDNQRTYGQPAVHRFAVVAFELVAQRADQLGNMFIRNYTHR